MWSVYKQKQTNTKHYYCVGYYRTESLKQVANKSFENVTELRYFGTTV
jgi:hypothetical protein